MNIENESGVIDWAALCAVGRPDPLALSPHGLRVLAAMDAACANGVVPWATVRTDMLTGVLPDEQ